MRGLIDSGCCRVLGRNFTAPQKGVFVAMREDLVDALEDLGELRALKRSTRHKDKQTNCSRESQADGRSRVKARSLTAQQQRG